jgi:hypothetical protein
MAFTTMPPVTAIGRVRSNLDNGVVSQRAACSGIKAWSKCGPAREVSVIITELSKLNDENRKIDAELTKVLEQLI